MSDLPVVVVGAGPAGLAAAAHLVERGRVPLVLESGNVAGASVAQWHHVRLFSAWSEVVDTAAARLLVPTGWVHPDPAVRPSGAEWVSDYLHPLAAVLGDRVRLNSTVVGVARRGRDRIVDSGRDTEPLVVHVRTPLGEDRIPAAAVIDASGTWNTPNPLGTDGLPALGELAAAERLSYRVPDLGAEEVRVRYAGRRVVVAGSGHSALTALIGLAALAAEDPATQVFWLLRRGSAAAALGGGDADQLPARGALGLKVDQALRSGRITPVTGFRSTAVHPAPGGHLVLESLDGRRLAVHEVIVLTGFRPDLTWMSEVRLDLDPVLQAPRALAPLIDPNVHSCGTVYPHGASELVQPEPGLYVVGMKSYGRATSYLSLTGYEQVRSVVAAIDGDQESAGRVELVLPESGVCGGAGDFDAPEVQTQADGCCGRDGR
ncbi:flavoprotein [Nakamurella silvestris]|nr:flavoprotein [Nakamurella silvestris]